MTLWQAHHSTLQCACQPPARSVSVAGIVGAKLLRNADDIAEGSIRVNLNTATLTELESIPGIGEVLAKQIVAKRPYTSIEQLLQIRGIGPTSLEGLGRYVKVEGETEKLR